MYADSFQLLLQSLVHGYKNFFLFFMNLDTCFQLLLMFVVGNLRNDMISHRVIKHAKTCNINVKQTASVIKLYTQDPNCKKTKRKMSFFDQTSY